MIGIIDYGAGNIQSVYNALNYLNVKCKIIVAERDFKECSKLILPGVGAFSQAMMSLGNLNFVEFIAEHIKQGKFLLGICLGMQLLLSKSSEHGEHKGLNFICGDVIKLDQAHSNIKIPNVGWCYINQCNDSKLLSGILDHEKIFYFVHGYYCKVSHPEYVTATLEYGSCCDVLFEHENIFGCQFHPEKSQKSGLKMLENFSNL